MKSTLINISGLNNQRVLLDDLFRPGSWQLIEVKEQAKLCLMPYLNKIPETPEPLDCRILTAALDLFVENGFHNVSVHEIQKRADVSIGSIYKHFGGKEGIAEALYTHILGEIEQLVDDILSDHDSAMAQCSAIIEALFVHTETHTNIIAYVFHAKHSEFLSKQPPISDAKPFLKMRAIIRQGMESGEFIDTDEWIAASSIFGAMTRMIQLRLDGVIPNELPEYCDQFLKTIWGGMAVERFRSHETYQKARA